MNEIKEILQESMRSLGAYLKAQLMVMALVFVLYSAGLFIIQVQAPVLKAAGIALIDFIPMVGSGLVMIPWVIIALVQGQKNLALALGILYVIITVMRMVLDPIITGRSVGLHPVVTVLVTLVGTLLLGPAGVIAGPLVAVVLGTLVRVRSLRTVEYNERTERKRKRVKR